MLGINQFSDVPSLPHGRLQARFAQIYEANDEQWDAYKVKFGKSYAEGEEAKKFV